jgi:quercetin dioxygenase-like cupin family protein
MSEESGAAARGLEAGRKEVVSSLVSYQAGSVVSRTIIKDRAGTVTLFAFDEGEAEVTVSGKASLLEGGEAIILPAGAPHAVRASKRFKMLLTMIRST